MCKKLSEEHKQKISNTKKGIATNKGMKYKKRKRDPQMYEDIKNGMRRKEFLDKYTNVSYIIYYSIKKELGM
jgi:hypothetical protein